ncbi:MAG: NUDIX hydrolase [Micrococcaceae bacterium]
MSRPIPQEPKRKLTPPPMVKEVSAGGLVVDFSTEEAMVAIICRTNRGGKIEWCLPKGHVEKNETNEEAAVREVAEETGIEGEILDYLGTVNYRFVVKGTRIYKTVYHYLMKKVGGKLTVENDPDAEADDAEWVPLKDLPKWLSFPNERKISNLAAKKYESLK